jgi:hypothetical protein
MPDDRAGPEFASGLDRKEIVEGGKTNNNRQIVTQRPVVHELNYKPNYYASTEIASICRGL